VSTTGLLHEGLKHRTCFTLRSKVQGRAHTTALAEDPLPTFFTSSLAPVLGPRSESLVEDEMSLAPNIHLHILRIKHDLLVRVDQAWLPHAPWLPTLLEATRELQSGLPTHSDHHSSWQEATRSSNRACVMWHCAASTSRNHVVAHAPMLCPKKNHEFGSWIPFCRDSTCEYPNWVNGRSRVLRWGDTYPSANPEHYALPS
jgi:hypothetical protein